MNDSTTSPEQTAEGEEETQAGTDQLGDAGKQAIDRMKQERNEERKARRTLEVKLAEYEKAEQAKADADKTEAEKRQAAEQRAEQAELRALRLEVAAEKGLTPTQAKRLVGATREELEADADEIREAFPTAPAAPERKAPKPDPSQGARGGKPLSGAEAGRAEAQKRFGTKPTVT
ncbi:hypothetical protein [Micromonospora rubida]